MQVRALKKCFVDNALREEGDVFNYNGPRNTNVEPINGSWNDAVGETTTAVMEAPKRKPGRPKMTKDTDGA